LTAFRDRVRNELVTVARHPQDVYDILGVLQEALREKIVHEVDEQSSQFRNGMVEQWAFVSNLRADVAQEYGYKESEG